MRLPVLVVITRHIRLTRSQRHPTNLVFIHRHECNQPRRINRSRVRALRHPVPLVANVGPSSIVIRRIAPRFVRNPGGAIGIIVGPVTLLIRRPAGLNPRPPRVTITIDRLPITVIIQVVNARDIRAHILIARIVAIRIVVIGIIQISVVAGVTSVVSVGILVTIVVVNQISGITAIKLRQQNIRGCLACQGKHFALADPSGSRQANHLGYTAQHGNQDVAIVVEPDVIKAGFVKLHRAIGSADFK